MTTQIHDIITDKGPASRPGIKTSKCCQGDVVVSIPLGDEGDYFIWTNCRSRCDVWHNRQEW
jgi:hypothetical protein